MTGENEYFDYDAVNKDTSEEKFCFFLLWKVPVLIDMLSIMKNMRTFFKILLCLHLKGGSLDNFSPYLVWKNYWQNKYLTMMKKIDKYYAEYEEFLQKFYHVYT